MGEVGPEESPQATFVMQTERVEVQVESKMMAEEQQEEQEDKSRQQLGKYTTSGRGCSQPRR